MWKRTSRIRRLSLLANGAAKMARIAKQLRTMGFATRTRLADKTRTVRSRGRPINANLKRRNDDNLIEVRRINTDLVRVAEQVARQAGHVVLPTKGKPNA